MERPPTFDPTECKYAVCHFNGTDNPQLNTFEYSSSFTFSDDIQKQCFFETEEPPTRATKLNTYHDGTFA